MARRRRPPIVQALLMEDGARRRRELAKLARRSWFRAKLADVAAKLEAPRSSGRDATRQLAMAPPLQDPLSSLLKVAPEVTAKRQKEIADLAAKSLRKLARNASDSDAALLRRLLANPLESLDRTRPAAPPPAGVAKTARAAARALGQGAGSPARYASAPLPSVARMLEKAGSGQLGRILGELGIGVERGSRLLLELLHYSWWRSNAGFSRRINTRGGLLYEALIPLVKGVAKAEDKVVRELALEWIKAEPQRFGLTAKELPQVERLLAPVGQPGTGLPLTEAGGGLADFQRLAQNLMQLRLNGITDESGRLVTDHTRVLLSVSEDNSALDLMPAAIGESKFKSKYREVVPQTIYSLERIRETLRAANLPNLAQLPIRVRWGSKLVLVIQSERPPPAAQLEQLVGAVQKATGKRKLIPTIVEGASAADAKRAREAVSIAMSYAEQVRKGK